MVQVLYRVCLAQVPVELLMLIYNIKADFHKICDGFSLETACDLEVSGQGHSLLRCKTKMFSRCDYHLQCLYVDVVL